MDAGSQNVRHGLPPSVPSSPPPFEGETLCINTHASRLSSSLMHPDLVRSGSSGAGSLPAASAKPSPTSDTAGCESELDGIREGMEAILSPLWAPDIEGVSSTDPWVAPWVPSWHALSRGGNAAWDSRNVASTRESDPRTHIHIASPARGPADGLAWI